LYIFHISHPTSEHLARKRICFQANNSPECGGIKWNNLQRNAVLEQIYKVVPGSNTYIGTYIRIEDADSRAGIDTALQCMLSGDYMH